MRVCRRHAHAFGNREVSEGVVVRLPSGRQRRYGDYFEGPVPEPEPVVAPELLEPGVVEELPLGLALDEEPPVVEPEEPLVEPPEAPPLEEPPELLPPAAPLLPEPPAPEVPAPDDAPGVLPEDELPPAPPALEELSEPEDEPPEELPLALGDDEEPAPEELEPDALGALDDEPDALGALDEEPPALDPDALGVLEPLVEPPPPPAWSPPPLLQPATMRLTRLAARRSLDAFMTDFIIVPFNKG